MNQKRRYIFDMHIHTARYSYCSHLLPEDLIKTAKELMLDGIVITEHGKPWPSDELSELNELSGKDGPLFLSGQEIRITGSDGREADVLVYGIDRAVGECMPADELLKFVESENGVAVAAHPRRNEV